MGKKREWVLLNIPAQCYRYRKSLLKFTSAINFLLTDRPACLRCPLDGEKITPEKSFRDKCCEREILDLKCSCRYEDRKCSWKGEFRNLKVSKEFVVFTFNPLLEMFIINNLLLNRKEVFFSSLALPQEVSCLSSCK